MSSRLPPPQGAPPSYAFVTRVYQSNLRPVVLFTAFLGGLFSLMSGVGWFRSYNLDRTQNVPQIANLSIALGALYMAVAAIGAYGIYSAATQRVGLVRIYTLLASFATLIIIAASLTRVVTHFIFKNQLLSECTTLSTNQEVVYYGFWGPVRADILDAQEAAAWCSKSWSHDSWSEILALLILGCLGVLFTVIAFAYYRQLLDPTSVANASRAPSSQVRMGGNYPSHYNPPYNASVPNLPYAYSAHPQYAPPAGPPPDHERDETFVPPYDGKPPSYVGGDFKGYDADGKDPFADFDGPSEREERDVTSRPYPGGSESFR